MDDGLGLGVQGAGRLVQDQDAGVGDQGAGDGDPLALAARQVGAAFLDLGVIGLGQFEDELVRPGQGGGGDQLPSLPDSWRGHFRA